jgi:hypothetical protein
MAQQDGVVERANRFRRHHLCKDFQDTNMISIYVGQSCQVAKRLRQGQPAHTIPWNEGLESIPWEF